jgi:uncharacterized membrane protein
MMGNAPVMAHLPALVLHVLGGTIGILSGYAAVLVAKGERLHRLFGKVFVAGMTVLATAAIYIAIRLQSVSPRELGNIGAGILVLYLMATSWMAVKHAPGTTGTFEKAAFAVAVCLCATYVVWGMRALAPHGFDGYPAQLYFTFAGLIAMFAAFDLRMILKGGVAGGQRIARHLGRMSTAWFIASGSFFLGQQKVMPMWMHGSNVLLVLALAPLGFMLFWMVRVRIGTRFKHAATAA